MKTMTEKIAEIRKNLKSTFPNFKFSIRKRHYCALTIALLASPIDFGAEYKSISEYWIEKEFKGEQLDVLKKIVDISFKDVIYRETGDYGTQPDFYIHIKIGDYNKPYKVI